MPTFKTTAAQAKQLMLRAASNSLSQINKHSFDTQPAPDAKNSRRPGKTPRPDTQALIEFDPIRFDIDIEPIAKGRHRHASHKKTEWAKVNNVDVIKTTTKVTTYTPAETRAFEATVKGLLQLAFQKRQDLPLHGRLQVFVRFDMAYPPTAQDTDKPDLDNLAKSFFDAAKGVLWCDDAIIVHKTLMKRRRPEAKISFLVRRAAADLDIEELNLAAESVA